MRPVYRFIVVLALLYLAYVILRQAAPVMQEGEGLSDAARVIGWFIAAVILAGVAGVVLAVTVVPAIGERVGAFFYSPDEEMEPDPHGPAVSLYAQGDYEGAIEAYRELLEKQPDDLQCASEIARIYAEKLEDPAKAAECLEDALEVDHGQDETAHLAFRLVDLYENDLDDHPRAVALLNQVIDTMPDTRHSANARHRLKVLGEKMQAPQESEEAPAPEPEEDDSTDSKKET